MCVQARASILFLQKIEKNKKKWKKLTKLYRFMKWNTNFFINKMRLAVSKISAFSGRVGVWVYVCNTDYKELRYFSQK